jgi:VWFA-related protein
MRRATEREREMSLPGERVLSVCGMALLFSVGLAGAVPSRRGHQATSSPELPTFHVGIDAVRIDAVVTDKRGRVVKGLTADDFELQQDGDRQAVTVAQYVQESSATSRAQTVSATGPPAAGPAPQPHHPLSADRVQRTIALVVDDLGLSWESIRDTRRAMDTFIDERVQPGDLVGILRTSTFSGAPQQFTTDKHRLHDIVDQVRWTALSRRGVGPFKHSQQSHGGYGGAEMDKLMSDKVGVHGTADPEVNKALTTLSALTMIVQGARELPSRKVVVLLSEGFRLDTEEEHFPDPRIVHALERLYDQAARAGVVIYTLDVRGLQTGCETGEARAAA